MVNNSYKSRIKQSKFKCDNCIKLKEEDAAKNNLNKKTNNNNASLTEADSKQTESNGEQKQQTHPSEHSSPHQTNSIANTSSSIVNDDDDDEDSIVIAKCLDCNVNLCSNCLLEHQIINLDLNHKLVSLVSKTQQQHNDINNNNSKLSDKNGEFYTHDKNSLSKSKHVSPINGSNKHYMKQQQHQSIHALSNLESQDLSGYLNNQTSDLMNKLSTVKGNQYQQCGSLNTSSTNDFYQLKRKTSSQELLLQQQIQQTQQNKLQQFNPSNPTKQQQQTSNQLKQFQYQQQLINQQHLKQIKLQQQQQQKLHLMNQQQQQQTQLNILNHNQNAVLNLVAQNVAAASTSSSSCSAISNIDSTLSTSNLTHIEAEIQKTYEFYVQMLKERKEYLIKELNTIINYALLSNQTNINKQVKLQYQLEMKKQQLEKETEQELSELKSITNNNDVASNSSSAFMSPISQTSSPNNNHADSSSISALTQSLNEKLSSLQELNNLLSLNNQLINQLKQSNPLQSIEFLSNYSAIQTSIRNTFGYLRINNNQSSSLNENNTVAPTAELNIICDLKPSKTQTMVNTLSNNSTKSTCIDSGLPSSSSSADSTSSSYYNENLSSPISIMRSNKSRAINSTTSSSLHSLYASASSNNNNNNDTIVEAASRDNVDDEAAVETSNEKIKSFFSNVNDLKASSTWSTSLSHENAAQLNFASPSSSFADYETFMKNGGGGGVGKQMFNLSDDEATTMAKSHGSLKCLNNPNVFSLRAGGAKSLSLTSLDSESSKFGMENNLNSKSGLLEHYSFQQQQAKLLASGGGHANSSLQLLRSKMIYHCKFGEFGITDGQFTEPSGVTINTNNDIIVADTNSHRIQIFDKDGRFKFKFGECGKRDGQLLYPNRVSIVKQTGDIVVTERSPTHQIQIYNKYGQFLRKFGANILQHPRGVCVDYKGRIVVVECKVMRVLIFDLYGNVLQKFDCSKYLEFPNGVCCSNPLNNPSLNTPEEIYISDNRAHCIKVFDYNGNFIRQIGGEGITNYPIGVGINSNNEILVADNHNNFNLSVFSPDGQLINALESKVKHAQCFDVGLMDDGSIVLASKDYRIYVYKYMASTTTSSSSSMQNAHSLITSPTHNAIASASAAASTFSLMQPTLLSASSLNTNFDASQAALFNLFTNSTNNKSLTSSSNVIIDQNLSKCSNNDDQNIIDNFEINLDDNNSMSDPVSFLNANFLDTSGLNFNLPTSIDLF